MQSPTPPTKPIPPTPPSMKNLVTTSATDATTTTTTVTPSTPSVKETPTPSPNEQIQSSSAPQSTSKTSPATNASSNAKETTTQTTTASTTPVPKTTPASSGITFFLITALLASVATIAMLWFKNNKPKPRSTVDYSTENTDDIVSLILSQSPAESPVQVTPKAPPKKLVLKPAPKAKNKGGFEIRI